MRRWNPTSQPAPLQGLSSRWADPTHPASAGPGAGQAVTEAGPSSPHLALASYHPGAPTPQPDSLTSSSCLELWEGAWPSHITAQRSHSSDGRSS